MFYISHETTNSSSQNEVLGSLNHTLSITNKLVHMHCCSWSWLMKSCIKGYYRKKPPGVMLVRHHKWHTISGKCAKLTYLICCLLKLQLLLMLLLLMLLNVTTQLLHFHLRWESLYSLHERTCAGYPRSRDPQAEHWSVWTDCFPVCGYNRSRSRRRSTRTRDMILWEPRFEEVLGRPVDQTDMELFEKADELVQVIGPLFYTC